MSKSGAGAAPAQASSAAPAQAGPAAVGADNERSGKDLGARES
jgi:hypothetical protein